MARGNSNKGGEAFAFGGNNAFAFGGNNAFAFAGNQAFAFGGAIDRYGFDGAIGNPMLVAGLEACRDAVLRERRPDAPKQPDWGVKDDRGFAAEDLPEIDKAKLRDWGGAPRAALIQLELLGRVRFSRDGDSGLELRVDNASAEPTLLLRLRRPDLAYFRGQLRFIDSEASLRESRMAEILTQVTTPMSYFASVLNMRAERHRCTLELLDHCLRFAYAVGMRFKHAFAVPRPSDLSGRISPMIEVPPHSAFPMGHATEAHVIAGVLDRLVPGLSGTTTAQLLRRIAWRIADNRVVAGVHYPVDGIAGRLLGDSLAEYLAASGTGNGQCQGRQFTEPEQPDAAPGVDELFGKGPGCSPDGEPFDVIKATLFGQLWSAAEADWQLAGSADNPRSRNRVGKRSTAAMPLAAGAA